MNADRHRRLWSTFQESRLAPFAAEPQAEDCPACMSSAATWPEGTPEPTCTDGCTAAVVLAALDALAPNLERSPLRRLDVRAMFSTTPPPVPWIVEPLLVRSHVTMLAGREGTGKSMLALALAAALGNGAEVAGLEATAPASVLYVDAENGPGEVHRRVHGLAARPEALEYREAVGFDLMAHMATLERDVRDYRPGVVILDSLRSLAPSWKENDSDAAEAVIGPLRRLARDHGLAVLVLHHAGKGSGGAEYRGSSGLGAAVEVGFTLARDPLDPEKRTRRALTCWKMRPAAEPAPRWLSLDASAGTLSIAEAEPFEPSTEGPSSQVDHVANRMVHALARGPMARKALCATVPVDENSGTAKRAIENAIRDGRIERLERGVYGLSGQDGPMAGPWPESVQSGHGPSDLARLDRSPLGDR